MNRKTLWHRVWARLTRRATPATESSEAKGSDAAARAVPPLPRAVTLGGRRFVEVTEPQNAAQYLYLMRYVRASKLHESVVITDPKADPFVVGSELLGKVLDSGCLLNVLAGTLVPEGVTWTQAVAEDSVRFFEALTGREDIATLQAELVRLLLDFFGHGVESPRTSPSSSAPRNPETTTPSETTSTAPEALATSAPSAP